MSDDPKRKETRYEVPMVPIYGFDIGEKLGSIDARLHQHDKEFAKINEQMDRMDARMDRMEAKLTAKIEALDTKLTAKIEGVDVKLTAKIEAVDSRLSQQIAAVDARVDKCLLAINRLAERGDHLQRTTWGIGVALLLAIIGQKLI